MNYCAVDLHGDNGFYGIIDENGKRVFNRRISNDLPSVLEALKPYRDDLKETGIVVESTFNWYWLVDGLMENGYDVHLANPAAIHQYDGLKCSDDKTDAFFLAELARLGILPEAHIYKKEERPVRDMLRRRLLLVRQRTQHKLSLGSLFSRETGGNLSSNEISKLRPADAAKLFDSEHNRMMAEINLKMIRFLEEQIKSKALASKLSKACYFMMKNQEEFDVKLLFG